MKKVMKVIVKKIKGFTLVELMVSVAITVVLVGVGVTSMTRFYARDKITAAKNELVSGIKLARTYATTSQVPAGYAAQLDYVALTLSTDGTLTVYPVNVGLGVGTSYFSKVIKKPEVPV